MYYVPRSESKIHSLAKLNKKKMLSFSTWVHLSRYNNHWWICTLTTFSHIFQRPSLKIVLANKKFIANFEMCVPYAIGKERWLTLAYSIVKKNDVILLGQLIALQCVCVFPLWSSRKNQTFPFCFLLFIPYSWWATLINMTHLAFKSQYHIQEHTLSNCNLVATTQLIES